jgi:hypothetical protein
VGNLVNRVCLAAAFRFARPVLVMGKNFRQSHSPSPILTLQSKSRC